MAISDKVKTSKAQFADAPPAPVEPCPFAQPPPTQEPTQEDQARAETLQDAVPILSEETKEKPKKPKTWIKIKLVDMRGKPIRGERYRIKVPGVEQPYEGTLDNEGEAAVYDIDPGTCKVTFPDLDEEAWEDA